MLDLHRDKNSQGENRGEMGRSFVTTGINWMAMLQLLVELVT